MRLFKYVCQERIDILETQRIAVTPPEEFNDVFDTRPHVVPFKNRALLRQRAKIYEEGAIKSLPPSFHQLPRKERREKQREYFKHTVNKLLEHADDIAQHLQNEIPKSISKHLGVLCLSTNPDHKLMWGHYADGHRGFVLEFDASNPRFSLTGNLHQVIYSDTPGTYDPLVGSQGWWKVKSREWEYEKEYRITMLLKNCEQKKLPNGKIIYLKHLPRACVKAVFMGLRMEAGTKKRLQEICRPASIEMFEASFLKDGSAYEFKKIP